MECFLNFSGIRKYKKRRTGIFEGLILLIIVLHPSILFAQTHTITGEVYEKENHQPLAGVNIVPFSNHYTGTITDLDGKFSLRIFLPKDQLRFSFLGKKTVIVQLSDSAANHIELEDDIQKLEEISVVGYGKAKRYYLVGVFRQVERKDWFYRVCRKLFKKYPVKYSGAECKTESGEVKE